MSNMIKIQKELGLFIPPSDFDTVTVEAEVEISWAPPQEPSCTSSTDCKDWPNSTCNITSDGKRRCLCNQNFLWDGLNLNCSTKG
jgi:hypothetical protein